MYGYSRLCSQDAHSQMMIKNRNNSNNKKSQHRLVNKQMYWESGDMCTLVILGTWELWRVWVEGNQGRD